MPPSPNKPKTNSFYRFCKANTNLQDTQKSFSWITLMPVPHHANTNIKHKPVKINSEQFKRNVKRFVPLCMLNVNDKHTNMCGPKPQNSHSRLNMQRKNQMSARSKAENKVRARDYVSSAVCTMYAGIVISGSSFAIRKPYRLAN